MDVSSRSWIVWGCVLGLLCVVGVVYFLDMRDWPGVTVAFTALVAVVLIVAALTRRSRRNERSTHKPV